MKLKELKNIIESKIIYLWTDDDCIRIKDKDCMYSKYGEYEVEYIYDDKDLLHGSHLDIGLYINTECM